MYFTTPYWLLPSSPQWLGFRHHWRGHAHTHTSGLWLLMHPQNTAHSHTYSLFSLLPYDHSAPNSQEHKSLWLPRCFFRWWPLVPHRKRRLHRHRLGIRPWICSCFVHPGRIRRLLFLHLPQQKQNGAFQWEWLPSSSSKGDSFSSSLHITVAHSSPFYVLLHFSPMDEPSGQWQELIKISLVLNTLPFHTIWKWALVSSCNWGCNFSLQTKIWTA